MVWIGTSELNVAPIALGGNVFGWTADKDASFDILDQFVDGGGNFIDTADAYSAWVDGHSGGESETIIGEWLAGRDARDLVIATKVGQHPDFPGLSAGNIRAAADASLARLGVDAIDLYYAHLDDESVPLEESIGAFGELVAEGKVRYIALSNFSADRVREWIETADRLGVPRPVAVQPHYNLVHREIEKTLIPVAQEFDLGLVPYWGLAKGFLTGKYRSADISGQSSPRAGAAVEYATPEGLGVIDALEEIATSHDVSIAAVALAWLRQQPTVVAPIASASKIEQLPDLLASASVELSPGEIASLNTASASFA